MTTNADKPTRKLHGGSLDMEWELKTRKKIQTSQIINRLIDHINGQITLVPSQVTAALGLLRKVLPDLAIVEGKIDHQHSYVARLPAKAQTPKTWQEQHSPAPLQ